MKDLNTLDKYREDFEGYMGNDHEGCFKIFLNGRAFIVIASTGGG